METPVKPAFYLFLSWVWRTSRTPVHTQTETFNHLTAPWARRSHYTWRWASARHRPCVRPGPCLTSSAQRPWCRCNGRTGTWGTSCEGRSSAPEGALCTTGGVHPAGRGWGRPSCWDTEKKELMHVFVSKDNVPIHVCWTWCQRLFYGPVC